MKKTMVTLTIVAGIIAVLTFAVRKLNAILEAVAEDQTPDPEESGVEGWHVGRPQASEGV